MSPAYKSDLKRDLSPQKRKQTLPFQPVYQSDRTDYQRDESNGEIGSQMRSDPNWDRKLRSTLASITSIPSDEVSGSEPAPGRRLA